MGSVARNNILRWVLDNIVWFILNRLHFWIQIMVGVN